MLSLSKKALQSRYGRFFVKAALFIALTAAGFEIAARLFLPNQVATWRKPLWGNQPHIRELYFLTPGSLRNSATYPIYKSNSQVRLLAYFPDASGILTREFDCTFRTDKRGFVSNDKDYEDSEILVLGDSYTVGSGGCDWVSRLSSDVRGRLYFAAHPGFGVNHWRAVLEDLDKTRRTTKILMILITNDIVRSRWKYTKQTIECIDLQRHCDDQIVIPITDKLQDVVAARSLRYRPIGWKTALKYYFPASFTLIGRLRNREPTPISMINKSISAIKEISSNHDLRLLWVTEKDETSGPTKLTRLLASALTGLNVSRCQIPAVRFLPRDYHPDAKGYDILKACVEKLVRGW